MRTNSRSVRINSEYLRRLRTQLGLTQCDLARIAGYTERLIRKAEAGGTLSRESVNNLVEALARQGAQITSQQLMLDIASVANEWLDAFDRHGREMVPYVRHHLAREFVFVCPGNPSVAPFIGTWCGVEGLQRWLDLYCGIFRRVPLTDRSCTVGEDAVNIRFLESGYIGDQFCGPIRINMHFYFDAYGLICRIDDDYDTQAGADNKAAAERRQQSFPTGG